MPAATRKNATADQLLAAAVGAVPGGAARPGQQAMATAIDKAVRDREHLLVQAGTGTGKSLAYLTPALLVDGPVVVSTATLALQNQLVEHDLPAARRGGRAGARPAAHLRRAQGPPPLPLPGQDGARRRGGADRHAVRRRAAPHRSWLGEAGKLGKQIQRLQAWAEKTTTGDRDELDPGVDDTAWRQVSMPARDCVGAAKCPYGAECFAEASRARAREADIVVTNHSLLAVDMLAEPAHRPAAQAAHHRRGARAGRPGLRRPRRPS